MTTLAISDIISDPAIQIRKEMHAGTVQRYQEAFEKLPPVDVFETPDGLLLADGFHRIEAARRLGLSEIEATVHSGTKDDAAAWGATANTTNGLPLTPEERNSGIRRLRQLHPDWSLRQIAEGMSCSHMTVKRVVAADEVRRSIDSPAVTNVTEGLLQEIAKAPREHWKPLVEAASRHGWSTDYTARSVARIRDDQIPDEDKRAILAGTPFEVLFTPTGVEIPPGLPFEGWLELGKHLVALQKGCHQLQNATAEQKIRAQRHAGQLLRDPNYQRTDEDVKADLAADQRFRRAAVRALKAIEAEPTFAEDPGVAGLVSSLASLAGYSPTIRIQDNG